MISNDSDENQRRAEQRLQTIRDAFWLMMRDQHGIETPEQAETMERDDLRRALSTFYFSVSDQLGPGAVHLALKEIIFIAGIYVTPHGSLIYGERKDHDYLTNKGKGREPRGVTDADRAEHEFRMGL